jgi:hypothetical protein
MTKSEYKAIRGERDFLFRFYKKMGGVIPNDQQFSMFLNLWLLNTVGIHPQKGIPQIVKFLDNKFG